MVLLDPGLPQGRIQVPRVHQVGRQGREPHGAYLLPYHGPCRSRYGKARGGAAHATDQVGRKGRARAGDTLPCLLPQPSQSFVDALDILDLAATHRGHQVSLGNRSLLPHLLTHFHQLVRLHRAPQRLDAAPEHLGIRLIPSGDKAAQEGGGLGHLDAALRERRHGLGRYAGRTRRLGDGWALLPKGAGQGRGACRRVDGGRSHELRVPVVRRPPRGVRGNGGAKTGVARFRGGGEAKVHPRRPGGGVNGRRVKETGVPVVRGAEGLGHIEMSIPLRAMS